MKPCHLGYHQSSTPLFPPCSGTWAPAPVRRTPFRRHRISTPRLPRPLPPRRHRAWVVASSSAKDEQLVKKEAPRRKQRLLNVLDGASMLGTVGGAVAVLLGADIMIIALPVVLPFVSLAIGRSKERARVAQLMDAEEGVKAELRLQREMVSDTQESVLDIGDELEEKLSKRLLKLEEKMGAMEGTIITTGKNTRQLVSGLRSMPKMLRKMAELQQQAVMYGISGEMQSILERWGSAQLQEIDSIGTRLRYLEDAVQRLELSAREQPAQISGQDTSYRYGDRVVPVEPMPMDDPGMDAPPFLQQAKESVVREVSAVLEDLKTSQADMLRSLQDLTFDQSSMSERSLDITLLEGQLEEVASQLGSLPSKMSDGVRQELGMFTNYKADIALQLSAVSRALQTLERVVLDMREDVADRATRELFGSNVSSRGDGQLEELRAGVYSISQELRTVREALFDFKRDATTDDSATPTAEDRLGEEAASDMPLDDAPGGLEAPEEGHEPAVQAVAEGTPSTQLNGWNGDAQTETNGHSPPATASDTTSKPRKNSDSADSPPEGSNRDRNSGTPRPAVIAGVFSEKASPTVLEFLPAMNADLGIPEPASAPPMPDYLRNASQPDPIPIDSYANYAASPPPSQIEQFPQGGGIEDERGPYGEAGGLPQEPPPPRGGSDDGAMYRNGGAERSGEGFGAPFPNEPRHWGDREAADPSFTPSWSTIGMYGESTAPGYPSPSSDPMQGEPRDFAQPNDYKGNYTNPNEPYDSRAPWYDQPPLGGGANNVVNGQSGAPAVDFFYREEVGMGAESRGGGYAYPEQLPGFDSIFPEEGTVEEAIDDPGPKEAGALAKVNVDEASDTLVEGLQRLKEGRKAVDEDFGEAYRLLCESLDCFERKLEEEAANVKALGNCGNALLALGELKLQMVESLLEVDPGPDRSRNSQALTQLREEAQQFLTLAGQKFKRLLEASPKDERGYMNWAKALSIRAKLTMDPSMQDRLFNAAAVKYEQVLSMRPGFPAAVLAYASVLKDWASSRPERDITAIELMQQAIACLEDVLRSSSSDSIKEEAACSKQDYERILESMNEA